MRLGELLALRWDGVDLDARRVIVHRAVSAGVEGSTKSWQTRFVPLADSAASALARLAVRGDYTSRDDYVFCSRLGRRLDGSALRRRYKAARKAAGLRPLRFHSPRHAAGSRAAREAGAHFVQAFLGHSRLSTTERYLHAKARPEDVATLNRAFATAGAPWMSGIRDATWHELITLTVAEAADHLARNPETRPRGAVRRRPARLVQSDVRPAADAQQLGLIPRPCWLSGDACGAAMLADRTSRCGLHGGVHTVRRPATDRRCRVGLAPRSATLLPGSRPRRPASHGF
jgi:hypothetical protein